MRLAQGGPLGRRFLHPVFAEHALAGIDQRLDRDSLVGLADRDQGHVGSALRCAIFAAWAIRSVTRQKDVGEQGGWIGHGALL
jgi:hypothetical protein